MKVTDPELSEVFRKVTTICISKPKFSEYEAG